MKSCPACHHANPDEARFCNGCGASLRPSMQGGHSPARSLGVLWKVLSGLVFAALVVLWLGLKVGFIHLPVGWFTSAPTLHEQLIGRWRIDLIEPENDQSLRRMSEDKSAEPDAFIATMKNMVFDYSPDGQMTVLVEGHPMGQARYTIERETSAELVLSEQMTVGSSTTVGRSVYTFSGERMRQRDEDGNVLWFVKAP